MNRVWYYRYGAMLLATLCLAAADRPVGPFESPGDTAPRGRIDELVFAKLRQAGIPAAKLCSDEVFLRRAYLDVIGTLPTPEEAAQFLADRNPQKRAALVDKLLDRPEFADYWALKWSDALRIKSEFPINLWPNAVQAYYRWIHTATRDNLAYDRFARELLVSSGSNFRDPRVNFYRAVESKEPRVIAQAVALTFMGARAADWPKERLDGMAAFFAQVGYKNTAEWKEEIVFFDPLKGGADTQACGQTPGRGRSGSGGTRADQGVCPTFPDGTPARIAPGQDPREVFANWLLAPGNPWFARAAVNRVWAWLMGRGIVHEPDDIRPDNPASNPELLAYLERELVGAHYDLKHIYRLILNSQAYQLSSIPVSRSAEAAANFAYYPARRLDAEVLIDAICQITGTTEEYSSPIPEPYTFLPDGQRAIALADGSIGSPFLEMFGRPARDTGLAAERDNSPSAEQRLHMLNSSHIQLKIQQSAKLRQMVQPQPGDRPRAALDRLYLAILSRYPTDDEVKTAGAYVQAAQGNRWLAMTDLTWALVNSAEFLCRH